MGSSLADAFKSSYGKFSLCLSRYERAKESRLYYPVCPFEQGSRDARYYYKYGQAWTLYQNPSKGSLYSYLTNLLCTLDNIFKQQPSDRAAILRTLGNNNLIYFTYYYLSLIDYGITLWEKMGRPHTTDKNSDNKTVMLMKILDLNYHRLNTVLTLMTEIQKISTEKHHVSDREKKILWFLERYFPIFLQKIYVTAQRTSRASWQRFIFQEYRRQNMAYPISNLSATSEETFQLPPKNNIPDYLYQMQQGFMPHVNADFSATIASNPSCINVNSLSVKIFYKRRLILNIMGELLTDTYTSKNKTAQFTFLNSILNYWGLGTIILKDKHNTAQAQRSFGEIIAALLMYPKVLQYLDTHGKLIALRDVGRKTLQEIASSANRRQTLTTEEDAIVTNMQKIEDFLYEVGEKRNFTPLEDEKTIASLIELREKERKIPTMLARLPERKKDSTVLDGEADLRKAREKLLAQITEARRKITEDIINSIKNDINENLAAEIICEYTKIYIEDTAMANKLLCFGEPPRYGLSIVHQVQYFINLYHDQDSMLWQCYRAIGQSLSKPFDQPQPTEISFNSIYEKTCQRLIKKAKHTDTIIKKLITIQTNDNTSKEKKLIDILQNQLIPGLEDILGILTELENELKILYFNSEEFLEYQLQHELLRVRSTFENQLLTLLGFNNAEEYARFLEKASEVNTLRVQLNKRDSLERFSGASSSSARSTTDKPRKTTTPDLKRKISSSEVFPENRLPEKRIKREEAEETIAAEFNCGATHETQSPEKRVPRENTRTTITPELHCATNPIVIEHSPETEEDKESAATKRKREDNLSEDQSEKGRLSEQKLKKIKKQKKALQARLFEVMQTTLSTQQQMMAFNEKRQESDKKDTDELEKLRAENAALKLQLSASETALQTTQMAKIAIQSQFEISEASLTTTKTEKNLLQSQLESLEALLATTITERDSLQCQLKTIEASLLKVQEEQGVFTSELQQISAVKKQLEEDLFAEHSTVERLTQQLEDKNENEHNHQRTIEKLRAESRERKDVYEDCQKSYKTIAELEQKITTLDDKIKTLEYGNKKLSAEKTALSTKNSELSRRNTWLEQKLRDIAAEREAAQKKAGAYPQLFRRS